MRRRSAQACLLAASVLLVVPHAALAQRPDAAAGEGKARDTALQPDTRDILLAGAVLGAAVFFDRSIHEEVTVEANSSLAPLARAGSELGRQRNALAALAVVYGIGRATDRPGLSGGALRAAAGMAATGLVDQGFKHAIGRDRPVLGGDADEFRPFDSSGTHHSFPSHHTAVAFSLATSVAEETNDRRLSAAAYAAAALVGWSRIHQGEHWASDVAGGAILGTFTTRAVNRWLRARDGDGPRLGVSRDGVLLQIPTF